MRLFKYLLFTSIILLFTACSSKQTLNLSFENIKQNSKKANNNFMDQDIESFKFLKQYFKPWEIEKLSLDKNQAAWGLNYRFKKIYLENHRLAKASWFKKQEENFNLQDYNTLLKKAISLKNTNVRVLPSSQAMFYEPNKQGEGFPFDYNQNSRLKINTPILVSHLSKDKAWAYVQTSSYVGWVKINDIAFVNEEFIKEFKTQNYYIAVKEKFAIYDNNIFKDYIKLATLFPKKNNKYLIAKADAFQNAQISYINIKKSEIKAFPIKYNEENRIAIAKALFEEPYGWGGLLNNRDCSSFTKDFFAVFGKYLSRNSKAQSKNGKYFDISNMSKREKKEFIAKNAVAFSTLVYLKGHIMLYIGSKNNEPLVMHNMWSVRLEDINGVKYRHIIGQGSITSLEPGRELEDFNEKSNILNKIKAIIIL